MEKKLTLSLLVPCFNEERSLEASMLSCLHQTRAFDQIIFVDDCSNDNTSHILARYRSTITTVRTPHNTGNKSSAQEYGLQFVTGDILVTTDADTLLHPRFAEWIEEDFGHPHVAAVAGYVESLPHNWLTLCRAYYYVIGQDIHKVAQHYLNYIFVMPGAASAFRTDIFRTHIVFDHDTITEDLDFTYKLHRKDLHILYDRRAISYTQDPTTLSDYVNQMRRWYSGGWQNLVKHISVVDHPARALELSLIYTEGFAFSFLILVLPIINPVMAAQVMAGYLAIVSLFALWAAVISKRADILLAPIPFLFLMYVNAWIFLETFFKEIVMRRKTLIWFKPGRTNIPAEQGRHML